MSINKKFEELIKKYISNEISDSEKEQLLSEAKVNKEIADLIQLHQQMSSEDLSLNLADEQSFKEMRLSVLNEVNSLNDAKNESAFKRLIAYIINLFKLPAFNVVVSACMFLLGFYLNQPSQEFELVNSIYTTASQSQDLESSIDAPYIYQNASFKELPDGNVTVSFDVSRHLEITRSKKDELVQDILAQSLLNSSSLPARLRNISDTRITMHPKIKEALIATMLNDSHPIVRQKSLFSLMKYKNDEEIQKALIKLLSEEESIYMRLAAIDYLANNDVDLTMLEGSINLMDKKNNSAVNQKIKQLKY